MQYNRIFITSSHHESVNDGVECKKIKNLLETIKLSVV